ncbi:MAG: PAS sensor protein [Prevotellaceae bacterium]|jgi:transcriptional regulator with PAS, ATPase and Fis domain|nr:PAS sensor protein [Prevotellaceae bacterium]
MIDYFNDTDCAVTVCDLEGTVVYCNEKAKQTFAKYGDLLGKNLKDCHSPGSWEKIVDMLHKGESNTYTIEKAGLKKIIHQMPWREHGEVRGLVELSIVLPIEMLHYVRE